MSGGVLRSPPLRRTCRTECSEAPPGCTERINVISYSLIHLCDLHNQGYTLKTRRKCCTHNCFLMVPVPSGSRTLKADTMTSSGSAPGHTGQSRVHWSRCVFCLLRVCTGVKGCVFVCESHPSASLRTWSGRR